MIEIKGPFPKLPYTANMKKEIGMMCGGTGITPMLQVTNTTVTEFRISVWMISNLMKKSPRNGDHIINIDLKIFLYYYDNSSTFS